MGKCKHCRNWGDRSYFDEETWELVEHERGNMAICIISDNYSIVAINILREDYDDDIVSAIVTNENHGCKSFQRDWSFLRRIFKKDDDFEVDFEPEEKAPKGKFRVI